MLAYFQQLVPFTPDELKVLEKIIISKNIQKGDYLICEG